MNKTEQEIKLEEELAGGLERERIHLARALRAEKACYDRLKPKTKSLKFEETLKAMRKGKILTMKNGIWKYRLIGKTFQFALLKSDSWTNFPHFPCFLLLSDSWEIVDD